MRQGVGLKWGKGVKSMYHSQPGVLAQMIFFSFPRSYPNRVVLIKCMHEKKKDKRKNAGHSKPRNKKTNLTNVISVIDGSYHQHNANKRTQPTN